jgi:integrase
VGHATPEGRRRARRRHRSRAPRHLAAAISASKSDHAFSRPDGSAYTPDVRFRLVDHLRRALKRSGIVDGYRHICRRKGCGFEETRAAPSEDRCPRCKMRLWVSPMPRKLRFYDLRHTHATLLRKAGVDLGAVQRSLGHSSPEITAAIYDHSDLEDTGRKSSGRSPSPTRRRVMHP